MISQTATKVNAVYGEWQSKRIARGLVEMATVQFTPDVPGEATAVKVEVRITPTGKSAVTQWVPAESVEAAEALIAAKMAAL